MTIFAPSHFSRSRITSHDGRCFAGLVGWANRAGAKRTVAVINNCMDRIGSNTSLGSRIFLMRFCALVWIKTSHLSQARTLANSTS